jgi:hypothetical protein
MNVLQVCPNCNGQKTVSRPPWVAGDINVWVDGGTAIYPCPTCQQKGVIEVKNTPVLGNYQFYPYKPTVIPESQAMPFAYSIALVEKNEDDGCGEFYTYLDFWVVKNLDNVKKTLKRRGVTVDSKNYQLKVYYTDGGWDFVSLREALS